MKWNIYQLDVKSAFLNGFLQEEIYVEQPDGFKVKGKEDHVYLLKKALYGLKQAPRAWYSRIDSYLIQLGFIRSKTEPTLYVQKTGNELLVISLYVDDLLVTGSSKEMVEKFKLKMMEKFEMTDLGLMSFFLGMEVKQSSKGIFISQEKYAKEMLKKFAMENCKPVATPMTLDTKLSKDDGAEKADDRLFRSLIGSLLYLAATRPDIMFAVSKLSRFMSSPSDIHLKAAKRILRYVKGTVNYGVLYSECEKWKLVGHVDSDWGGSADDMKSTTGFAFSLGSGMFCWQSRKQDVVAQSTAEAEYIAASSAVNHAIWIRKLLSDLGYVQSNATEILCDNQSAIAISKNPVLHGRTKHIKIKYHAIREAQENGEVNLVHCESAEQVADLFTKALPLNKFEYFRSKIEMCSK